jgi:hypothetical protein
VDFYDRSLTFLPSATPGTLVQVYTMFREFLSTIWFHTLTADAIALNVGVTELDTGTVAGEAAPGIHGRQSGPALANDKAVVMHLDSEYRNRAWNTRLYRRGTAESLTDGTNLSHSGRSAYALVAASMIALFVDNSAESYHELVLTGDGADAEPIALPGVVCCTPVAFIRVGGIVVKAPPF